MKKIVHFDKGSCRNGNRVLLGLLLKKKKGEGIIYCLQTASANEDNGKHYAKSKWKERRSKWRWVRRDNSEIGLCAINRVQIFAIIRPSTLIKKVSGLSVFWRAAVHCYGLITLPGSWKARVQPERVVTGLQRVMEVLQSSWFWCFVTEDGDSDGPQDTYPGDSTGLNFELHKPDEMKYTAWSFPVLLCLSDRILNRFKNRNI